MEVERAAQSGYLTAQMDHVTGQGPGAGEARSPGRAVPAWPALEQGSPPQLWAARCGFARGEVAGTAPASGHASTRLTLGLWSSAPSHSPRVVSRIPAEVLLREA